MVYAEAEVSRCGTLRLARGSSALATRARPAVARRWDGQRVTTLVIGLSLGLLGPRLSAQSAIDTVAIRGVVADEITAWDRGDAVAYSRHVAADASFTNIRGQFFTGYAAFLHQHETIFRGLFKGTKLQQDIVSLRFARPDVAVVEVLTAVSGVTQPRPGMTFDQHGRLRTRLLQVLVREGGEWKVVAYHNVDVKPGVPVPEPQ